MHISFIWNISVHGEGFIHRENIMEYIYMMLLAGKNICIFTVTAILITYTVNNPYITS